jgi:hypothetical protein
MPAVPLIVCKSTGLDSAHEILHTVCFCAQVPNALRSTCRICGEGQIKIPSNTTGVCTPQKCFRAALRTNWTTDTAICGARACNATTGLCTGEVSAHNGARCASGSTPGACVHGQCRQVNAGVAATTGPVLGGWMLSRLRVSDARVKFGLLDLQ